MEENREKIILPYVSSFHPFICFSCQTWQYNSTPRSPVLIHIFLPIALTTTNLLALYLQKFPGVGVGGRAVWSDGGEKREGSHGSQRTIKRYRFTAEKGSSPTSFIDSLIKSFQVCRECHSFRTGKGRLASANSS